MRMSLISQMSLCVLIFFCSFSPLLISHAESLQGTPQDDSIVSTENYDGIISYEGNDTIIIESSSQIIGNSQQTFESTADADLTTVDSGSGDDQVTNHGAVSATADAVALPKTETASTATSRATAINSGDGVDEVENTSIIGATSTATATTDDMVFTAAGDNSVDVSAGATAVATGISSGVGSLMTTNSNTITVEAEANATAGEFTTQLLDKSSMDGGVTAHATAIGIFIGSGGNNGGISSSTNTNEGLITTTATAKANNSDFRNEVMDWAVADTTASAIGEAIGIKTGLQNNSVENQGTIQSTATAQSELWKVEFNITDWGLGASGLTVESKATGIEGNDGIDQINNDLLLEATATSTVNKTTINFSFIDATFGAGFWEEILGDSVGGADTLSKASAVGIGGEEGDDFISNKGTINVFATSTLTGTAVSVGAEGIPSTIIDVLQGKSLASASPTAETSTIGILGGIGNDTITNNGILTTAATSTADDISVNLSLPLLEKLIDFPSPAFALGGAGVTAISNASGIDGNEGDDTIEFNYGLVDVDAMATTTGVIASAALQGFVDDISYFDLQVSVADTSLRSESAANGIDGGDGNDIIKISDISTLDVDSTATATSTKVSAAVQGKIKEALNVGASLVRADTTASAIASGIEGGEGDDTIDTAGTVTITAAPYAKSTAVSAEVQLYVEKSASMSGAISDTSTKALATDVTGISGGDGSDSITNSGMLNTTALPEAESTKVNVVFQNVDQGLVAGITYIDAETGTEAEAVGIDGGKDQDIITNTSTGQIEVNADSKSISKIVGVTAEVSFTKEVSAIFGGAVTDGTTTAVATAIGVDGGDDDDTVDNFGQIKVQANKPLEEQDPDAKSIIVSTTVTGAPEGVTAAFSYADAETTVGATSIGIDGGFGDDTITNANSSLGEDFSLESSAYAVSSSDTVTVSVSGTWEGISLGASLADASTAATATAVGIDGGSGKDIVASESGLRANAEAKASSTTVTVNGAVSIKGISAGAAVSDVKTNSEAVAAGIDSGAGDDEVTNESTVDVSANAVTETDTITINISTVGAAISDASLTATSETIGIDGGVGIDTLTNEGGIIVESTSTVDNLGATINFAGATRGDASIEAFADAIGMCGDDADDETAYGDTLSNLVGGSIEVESHAKIYGNRYAAQGGGILFAKAEATVDAKATGIAGGVGSDTLKNEGSIVVTTDSVADVKSMNFQLSGVALTKAGINAEARSTGIYGGNGSNEITNSDSGSIEVKAEVDTLAASLIADFGFGVDLTGVSGNALATGIQSGDAEDTINNHGDISVTARALGEAGNAAIGLAHLTNATSFTDAAIFGIESGGGRDFINNTGSISVGLVDPDFGYLVKADTESVAMSLLGFSISSMGAKAQVTGISAGDGDDDVHNSGSLIVGDPVNWMVKGESFGYAGQFIGLEIGASATSSSVTASGIDGGKGNDVIINETINDTPGNIEVHARSYAYVDAEVNISTFGDGGVEGKSVANTSATGISGGIGNDGIENYGEISVDAYGRAEGEATVWIGWGGPEAKMKAEVSVDAFGIDGGAGSNTISNFKKIDVQSGGDTWSYSEADTDVKDNKSNATSDMTINASGIAAGDDNNAVTNLETGTIDVTARAGKPAIAVVVKSYADEDSTASAIAESSSTGIALGDGGNTVDNYGRISVTSEVIQQSYGRAKSIPSDSYARSKTDGSADVTGIRAGDGDNEIKNRTSGVLEVTAVNTGIALSDYTSAHLTNSLAYAGLEKTTLTSDAAGILVGEGTNLIENHNGMIISSSVNATATAKANTTRDTNYAESYAGGIARGYGILAGNGQNKIYNYASMEVSAETDAKAYGYGEDYGMAFTGSKSSPGPTAAAFGISAGQGINEIINYGTGFLEVNATATAYSYAYADTYADDPHGTAIANSYAAATGIQAGDGGNSVSSYGTINVTANAVATAAWHVDSTWGDEYLDFYSSSESNATGIQTGIGNDNIIIGADGELSVMAISNNFLALTDTIAIGVDGGDGNNLVENHGHIFVSADSKVTIGSADAAAAGIQTGNGNDTIKNSGTIETIEKTQVYIVSMSNLGVAITSGGGNDQLFLMDGSVTKGSIDLGEGDDSLVFSGTPLVEGDMTGSAGIDTLIFDGPGYTNLIPMAFENAQKQGAGTYTTAVLSTMQRVDVNQGTLQVDSNYAMANDSIFQTIVNGDSSHGQLNVNGNVQLNGELNVVKGPGFFRNGTLYDIIVADEVDGIFSSEVLPAELPLLSFQTTTLQDRVEVEVLAKSFTAVATNSLQQTIARHLDNIMPQATGDLELFLGDIQRLSEPDFDQVFAGLSPDSYNNSSRITLSGAEQYIRTMQQRMHSLRSSLKIAAAETPPKNGVWLQGLRNWGDQEGEDGFTGYDYSIYGGTIGLDRLLKDHALLGFSTGVSGAEIDFDNNLGKGDIDAFIMSLYGSWFNERYYLDASLSFGNQDYSNSRNIIIGGIERTYSSNHNGTIFSSYLEGGYNFSFGSHTLGLFAVLNYLYLDEDGFTESGDGVLDLKVDDRQTEALFSQLGAVAANRLTFENFDLMPELRVAWKHDFEIDDQVITAAYTGAPDVKFSIEGQNVEQDSILFEAGATLFYKDELSIPIKYAVEFRDDYSNHALFGLIRYEY